MSIFSNLESANNLEQQKDTTGGYTPLQSGVYDCVIEMAYADASIGGAKFVDYTFKMADGKTHKERVYATSSTAKGGRNYYERDGKKIPLPGFTTINDIALLTIGKEANELEAEPKTLSVWNPELRKETPQQKQVLMDLLGQEITLGLIQVQEDSYKDPTVSVTKVQIDKVFRTSDHLTVAEIKGNGSGFYDTWSNKNTGQIRDRRKQSKEGGTTQQVNKPSSSGGLFG